LKGARLNGGVQIEQRN